MKKITLGLLLFIVFINCFGQLHKDWATYYGRWNLGAGGGTSIYSSVYDPVNHYIYVAGTTSDTVGIASPGSFKSHLGVFMLYESDLFLAKFDTLGNRIWGTYYGGTGMEAGGTLALDHEGNVYLSGCTGSATGIATAGAHASSLISSDIAIGFGGGIPFLVKFNSNGQRLWGTYYGDVNPNGDVPLFLGGVSGVATDAEGNVYMAGGTINPYGYATSGSFKSAFPTGYTAPPDGYIVKFNAAGQRVWGTYYGSDQENDYITSLHVGNDGFLYAYGYTSSSTGIAGGSTTNQTQISSSYHDAFIAKFALNGQRIWGIYSGGNGDNFPLTITSDKNLEAVFVAGITTGTTGIGTSGTHQPTYGGGDNDQFLMRYNTDGTKVWGTYFGGENEESIPYSQTLPVNALLLDNNRDITMVGATNSATLIEKGCAYQDEVDKAGFIARFRQDGTLDVGSYFDAMLAAIVADPENPGSFYVSGRCTADGAATAGASQSNKVTGKPSGFFSKIIQLCPDLEFHISKTGNTLSVGSGHSSYEWFHNGISVNGATNPTLSIASASGDYYVLIKDSCGCSYTSDTLDFEQTSIDEIQKGNGLSLFPNPGDGWITIKGSFLREGIVFHYEVYDVMGRKLATGNFKNSNKTSGQSFDFSNLRNGIYTLKLWSDGGNAVINWVKDR